MEGKIKNRKQAGDDLKICSGIDQLTILGGQLAYLVFIGMSHSE